jgi:hypothetical protein
VVAARNRSSITTGPEFRYEIRTRYLPTTWAKDKVFCARFEIHSAVTVEVTACYCYSVVLYMFTDVSMEDTTSIFRVKVT